MSRNTRTWNRYMDVDNPHTSTTANGNYSNNYQTGRFQTHPQALPYDDVVWQLWPEVNIKITGLDRLFKACDLHRALSRYGNIERIEIVSNGGDNGTEHNKTAFVRFRPPPSTSFWAGPTKVFCCSSDLPLSGRLNAELLRPRKDYWKTIKDATKLYPERMEVPATSLAFGVRHQQNAMILMHRLSTGPMSLHFNLRTKELTIHFTTMLVDADPTRSQSSTFKSSSAAERRDKQRPQQYKLTIPVTQLTKIIECPSSDNEMALVISLETPPIAMRRLQDDTDTFKERGYWTDNMAWLRQSGIRDYTSHLQQPLDLTSTNYLIDIGRWTTYKMTITNPSTANEPYTQMRNALMEYNIEFVHNTAFQTVKKPSASGWDYVHPSLSPISMNALLSSLFAIESPEMPWKLKYQLEACVSQNCFTEYNITKEFVSALASLPEKKALGLLECALESRKKFHDPMEILRLPQRPGLMQYQLPKHCVISRTVNITPTTMHLSLPNIESSNRILRQYSELQDRFLRVRFSDEKNRGPVRSSQTASNDAIFTRFYHCLKYGIHIGGLHFKFLASGNSQFREHGAYFFARTPQLTTHEIRRRIGDLTQIRSVSKFTSRLGLSFSTTRSANTCKFRIVRIPDIIRKGYNYTDGVGKISAFLADLITSEFGFKRARGDPISVFQFRLGGMKGILAVDPTVQPQEVHIRESQAKFAAGHRGLEIIRCASFSSAYLNRQIILILQSLGVPDTVFMRKLKWEVEGYQSAMSDAKVAISKLTRQVDMNQMTLVIAELIENGFMKSQEPFVMTVLNLWRVHAMKYLKEKARLVVEKGAFLLGCVDETRTLKGYQSSVDIDGIEAAGEREDALAEIFLQIDRAGTGTYEVVEGVCFVARNPSLYPGDIRVVKAVNVPALHHLRNVVVFPQTGDQDIPSMCSGGDLDGDDFLIVWDQELIPKIWNERPANFSIPYHMPEKTEGPITIEDVAAFFVNYMKRDSLGLIAVAHTAQADAQPRGVRDPVCIQLADLHSQAVDYPKTGIPVTMDRDHIPKKYPHFLSNQFRNPDRVYKSTRLLGKFYDAVEEISFKPYTATSFDERILTAFASNMALEEKAQEFKQDYDQALQRIMSQHAIETEFEVWSTFVLKHAKISKDYTFHEEIGRLARNLHERFRGACFDYMGGNDFHKIAPMVAAMYRVTFVEFTASSFGSREHKSADTDQTYTQHPFISFPWIFHKELAMIARDYGRHINTAEDNGMIKNSVVDEVHKVPTSLPITAAPASCLAVEEESKRAHQKLDDLAQLDFAPAKAKPLPKSEKQICLLDEDVTDICNQWITLQPTQATCTSTVSTSQSSISDERALVQPAGMHHQATSILLSEQANNNLVRNSDRDMTMACEGRSNIVVSSQHSATPATAMSSEKNESSATKTCSKNNLTETDNTGIRSRRSDYERSLPTEHQNTHESVESVGPSSNKNALIEYTALGHYQESQQLGGDYQRNSAARNKVTHHEALAPKHTNANGDVKKGRQVILEGEQAASTSLGGFDAFSKMLNM